jgi:signal transduction histidine kinase
MGWDPRTWPASLLVPTIAAALMVAASAVISQQVMTRLSESQSQSLRDLASAYLDGLSPALVPAMLREDIWEVYDTLDRSRSRYAGLVVRDSVVTNKSGTVVASLSPDRFPTEGALSSSFVSRFGQDGKLTMSDGDAIASVRRDLVYQDRRIGTIWAEIDTSRLVHERQDVARTLLLTNFGLTGFFGFVGWLLVRRAMRPMTLLASRLDEAVGGRLVPIDDQTVREGSEAGRLYRSYNAVVAAVSEREALRHKLAEEERIASVGRLASAMAHEINNPLGGLFNAVDTLRTHGQEPSIADQCLDLIERGLAGIRDVVRAALVAYKGDQGAPILQRRDIEDLRLLITPEARRRTVKLEWQNELEVDLPLPGTQIRQAVLNLLLNALAATPDHSKVRLTAALGSGSVRIAVADEGPGIPPAAARYLIEHSVPGAPITGGQGLGLWIIRRVVTDLGGTIAVEAGRGGTHVSLEFPIPPTLELRRVA